MKMKKKMLLIALIVLVVLFLIVYVGITILSTEKTTITDITASDGEKFTLLHTIYSYPDESYLLRIHNKFNEEIHVFSGDGSGNKNVKIIHLCSNGNFNYYKAVYEYQEKIYDELFVYNKNESFIIADTEKHIEKHYDSILMFNDHEGEIFEIFIPAAKHQILNDNNGDYIGAYGERLIVDGNKEILEKIKFLVENPDVIKYDICSKEEIVLRCQELLQKYGGDQ